MTKEPHVLRPWATLERSPIHEGRIFRLDRVKRRSPRTGLDHGFDVIDSCDWVNVIPLTPAGQVVMVKQYRHAIDGFTLEVPGGMIDAGEPPIEAARRELQEESGYDFETIESLGRIHPNPAILTNWCHSFIARGCEPTLEVSFDSTEETELALVSLTEIPGLIRRGVITHALVVVAFHWLDLASREA